jgi:hypothetical protein
MFLLVVHGHLRVAGGTDD